MKNDTYEDYFKMLKEASLFTKECTVELETLFSTEEMTVSMDKINDYVARANDFLVEVNHFSDIEKKELISLITDFFQAMELLTKKAISLNEKDQQELIKLRRHEKSAVAYTKASGGYH